MITRSCLLLLLLTAPILAPAQRMLFFAERPAVQRAINEGDSAYFAGAFRLAVVRYDTVLAQDYSNPAAVNQAQNLAGAKNTAGLQSLLGRMADSGFYETWAVPGFDSLKQVPAFAAATARLQANQDSVVRSQRVQHPELLVPLMKMEYADQVYQWMTSFQSRYPGAYKGQQPHVLAEQAFRRNVNIVKQLVAGYGYLWKPEVGERGAHTLWLIAQHADFDTAFQAAFLQAMEPAVARGAASGKDLAYLTDRTRKNAGKPQVYGTQMMYKTVKDANGNVKVKTEVYTVEDPDNLDKRRAAVGLEPMAAYMELMRKLNNHD